MINCRTFAIVNVIEDSLFAIKCNELDEDEFQRIFNQWYDIEYLESFFEENKRDLQRAFYNYISVEDAVLKTVNEAEKLEQKLIELATKGEAYDEETLQSLFKPLNKSDESKYPIPDLQKSKAYGERYKSWLRIYAIRINENTFIVTGGAIKLTATMNEREHLKAELRKLKHIRQFLINEQIIDKDSLEDFMELS